MQGAVAEAIVRGASAHDVVGVRVEHCSQGGGIERVY